MKFFRPTNSRQGGSWIIRAQFLQLVIPVVHIEGESKLPSQILRACSGDQCSYVLHKNSYPETYSFPATTKIQLQLILISPNSAYCMLFFRLDLLKRRLRCDDQRLQHTHTHTHTVPKYDVLHTRKPISGNATSAEL